MGPRPGLVKGYFNNKAATHETFEAEGWLHLGGIAYVDINDTFFILDRLEERSKSKASRWRQPSWTPSR